MISNLHAKKIKKENISDKEKIKHLIDTELHLAQIKHHKTIKIYIIYFSIALLLLTIIYLYTPSLPIYVIILNISISLAVFAVGIYLINTGYKREIKDFITIEEHP